MADELKNFWVKFHYTRGQNVRLPSYYTAMFNESSTDDISVYTRDGSMWMIKLERHNNDIWLGRGWTEFKNRYNVQYRDSIYFSHATDNIFEVVIFGVDALAKNYRDARNEKRPIYFYKQLTRNDFRAKIILPDAFSTRFGKHLKHPLTLVGPNDVEAAVDWSVNIGWEAFTLSKGWPKFCRHNNIRRFDVLIFTYDWTNTISVDVMPRDSPSIDHFHTGYTPDPWDIHTYAFELFSVTLNDSFFKKKKQPLYVPARVVQSDFPYMPDMVRVRLPSGHIKEWKMIWGVERKECKIGKGWYEFIKENKLELGNKVIFGRIGMSDFFEVDFE